MDRQRIERLINFDEEDTSTGHVSVVPQQTQVYVDMFREQRQVFYDAVDKAKNYLGKLILEMIKAHNGEPILFVGDDVDEYADNVGPQPHADFTGEYPDECARMFGICVENGEPRVIIKWGLGDDKYVEGAKYKVPGPDEGGPVESWGIDDIYNPGEVFEMLSYNWEYLKNRYGIDLYPGED